MDDIINTSKRRGYSCDISQENGICLIHLCKNNLQYMLEVIDGATIITKLVGTSNGIDQTHRIEYSGDEGCVEAAIDLIKAMLRH